jgi:hypothetical protein
VKGEAKLADFGCSKSIQGLISQDLNTMQGTPYGKKLHQTHSKYE